MRRCGSGGGRIATDSQCLSMNLGRKSEIRNPKQFKSGKVETVQGPNTPSILEIEAFHDPEGKDGHLLSPYPLLHFVEEREKRAALHGPNACPLLEVGLSMNPGGDAGVVH